MDSRPPLSQHPFTRNAASPIYDRPSFPASHPHSNPHSNPIATTTAPFHPSHPASASPAAYSEHPHPHPHQQHPHQHQHLQQHEQHQQHLQHQRRPSDTSHFYPQSRPSYAPVPDPANHPPPTHSRHQSSSSINASLTRNMPPPSPPQHPAQQPPPVPHPAHQIGHYAGPPAPRAPPPVNLGPPSAFPSSRELPALNSIPRTGSTGGSMSISSMLGGPPPAPREPTPGHATSFPPPATTSAVSGPAYAAPIHASPRMQSANDYPPYSRRPQTPDQGRPFDARDHRGSAAGSPPQGMYGTPELSRFNTPQAYPPRGPPMDDRREPPGRMSTASVPPRPSSQPRSYHGMPPRSVDMGRGPPPGDPIYGRREEVRPPGPADYPDRPSLVMPYDEQRRFASEQELREVELREREREFQERELRERERRERERIHYEEQRSFMAERERIERERERDHQHMEMQREREREMDREMEMRERERERARRERTASDPSRPQAQHPADLGPQVLGRQQPYGRPDPRDPRDPAAWQRPGYDQPPPPRDAFGPPYLGSRAGEFPSTTAAPYGPHPAYAQPPPHERFPGAGPPPHVMPASQPGPQPSQPAAPSHPFESPSRHRFVQTHPQQQPPPPPQPAVPRGRPHEEGPPPPSVAYNGGPGSAAFEAGRPRAIDEGPNAAGHPRGFLGIQEINRKGRISPLPQAVQGAQPQVQGPAGEPGIKSEFGRMFSGIGSGVRGIGVSSPAPPSMQPQFASTGPARGDEEHPGHELPVDAPVKAGARGKRRKAKDDDGKGDDDSTGRITPVGRAKRPKTHAHHHHHQSVAASASTVVAKPTRTVSSQAVLDSVADRPRKHLGDVVYQVQLKPCKVRSPSKFGFTSNPIPLPMDMIKGNENSTLTMKIPRINLTPAAREEITSRRAVWGTDVYTDDSDVVAACIHAGWIRGEWSDDVDVDLLGLYKPSTSKKQRNVPAEQHLEVLTSPPASGPVHVPADRDLHVTLLILPLLEKYSSSTRFGIQSREFGGVCKGHKSIHDGISFMITSVRWVDGAAPQCRLRGKARRERIRRAMSQVNRSEVIDMGGKEISNNATVARDAGIIREKTANGKTVPDGKDKNGYDNKENRPAFTAVSNDVAHSSDQETGHVDKNGNLDEKAKEKSGSVDAQNAKTVAEVTVNDTNELEKSASTGVSE
ncbi:Rxt3-domain-containing protein [Hypoxylon sp. FL1284]|nr:Rxt3-domain-containing protein [Hypoxylon sp. FL1284]